MKFKDKYNDYNVIIDIKIFSKNKKYLEITITDDFCYDKNKKPFRFYANIFNALIINVHNDTFARLKDTSEENFINVTKNFQKIIKVHIKEFMISEGKYFIGL